MESTSKSLKNSIAQGAIGFSTERNLFFSRAIRWFTNYPLSHSFIIVEPKPRLRYSRILEADRRAVNYSLLGKYHRSDSMYEIWEPVGFSIEEIKSAIQKTERAFLYKKYSYAKILGIGLKITLEHIGINISNPVRMGTICSEVVWYYLSKLLPDIFGNIDHSVVTSKDLHKMLIESCRFRLIVSKEFDQGVKEIAHNIIPSLV